MLRNGKSLLREINMTIDKRLAKIENMLFRVFAGNIRKRAETNVYYDLRRVGNLDGITDFDAFDRAARDAKRYNEDIISAECERLKKKAKKKAHRATE